MLRVCQLCGTREVSDEVLLFKYSIRHYAHAWCIALRFGRVEAIARIKRRHPAHPKSNLSHFRAILRGLSEWYRARIQAKDDAIAAKEKAYKPIISE